MTMLGATSLSASLLAPNTEGGHLEPKYFQMLKEPILINAFQKYLEKNLCPENLLFYQHVERFREMSDPYVYQFKFWHDKTTNERKCGKVSMLLLTRIFFLDADYIMYTFNCSDAVTRVNVAYVHPKTLRLQSSLLIRFKFVTCTAVKILLLVSAS